MAQQMTQQQMGQMQQRQRGRVSLQPVRVEDVVQTDIVTVESHDTVGSIVAKMADQQVGTVIVVEDNEPVGVITDRDITLALGDGEDISQREATSFISESVATGSMDMNIFDALEQMSNESVRRLPIVDEDGQLEGLVTLDEMLVLLEDKFGQITDIVKAQSPRY